MGRRKMGVHDFCLYVVAVMLLDGTVCYRSFNDFENADEYAADALCSLDAVDVCIYHRTSL